VNAIRRRRLLDPGELSGDLALHLPVRFVLESSEQQPVRGSPAPVHRFEDAGRVEQKRLLGMLVEGEMQPLAVTGLEAACEGQQTYQMDHGRTAATGSQRLHGPVEGLVLPTQLERRAGEVHEQSVVARVLRQGLARQLRDLREAATGEQRSAE
jgi:hypothetical protein